jgi:hypothetical protein
VRDDGHLAAPDLEQDLPRLLDLDVVAPRDVRVRDVREAKRAPEAASDGSGASHPVDLLEREHGVPRAGPVVRVDPVDRVMKLP